ncbi:hypothetical protein LVD15_20775 [Fulvivirga maritima]|uniref:hypothetical protein n=1 Tax=Fulvivirga maritima TaxID=2904247 RepID=UPI001F38171F|nr:hypothetical protein [Fulvivirga maritima]UII25717.1 hypothetical protein LVD15_20775 [Fulvivirga maritima]
MPANKKYLAKSGWTKASKLLASLVGGVVASVSIHLALALWLGAEYIAPISLCSIFMLWGFFMAIVYWIKKPWMAWSVLTLVSLISIGFIYIEKL